MAIRRSQKEQAALRAVLDGRNPRFEHAWGELWCAIVHDLPLPLPLTLTPTPTPTLTLTRCAIVHDLHEG